MFKQIQLFSTLISVIERQNTKPEEISEITWYRSLSAGWYDYIQEFLEPPLFIPAMPGY